VTDSNPESAPVIAVVLAAGRGTRMRSDLPKVLHRLGGEPLVFHPIRAATEAGASRVVIVVGHGADQVQAATRAQFEHAEYAQQDDPRGTGHAVQCAMPQLQNTPDPATVLVLSGDVPGLRAQTLSRLLEASGSGVALATFRTPTPTGYGRIVRDAAGEVSRIVEERDASETERGIEECNGGVYAFALGALRAHLLGLTADNAQAELYLTDLVAAFVEAGLTARAVDVDAAELAGVNTPEQLAAMERDLGG
jgi:bifunctional UDP-N-acetylglucosamine pyrophosphorylase/glucosamine-1-phosphate N-acetyltransferase